jgi:hypothetical protein
MKKRFTILALIFSCLNLSAQDPVIKVHSATAFSLLRNCSNKVVITAPELGEPFSPQYEIEGATFTDAGAGLLAITPSAKVVKLKIINEGELIATESFRVRDIPQPVITVKHNGALMNFETGLDEVTGEVELQVEPNKDFAKHYPTDARFRVTKWSIAHMRGSQQLDMIKSSGLKADLSEFNDPQAGDYLMIKFHEIQRLNHQMKREVINIDSQSRIRIIPII